MHSFIHLLGGLVNSPTPPAVVPPATPPAAPPHEELANSLESLMQMPMDELVAHIVKVLASFGMKVLLAVVVYFLGRWLIKYLNRLIVKIMIRRDVDPSLRTFVVSLVRISLMIVLIIIIISILGIDTTSFVALFASAGLAVGLAMSGTLQNFAGGVMILLFKPYRVGHVIEAQGYTGTVKEIQLFNTVINTADNKRILIPNGGLSTGVINNYSYETQRRVEWVFGIGYGDNFDLAKDTIAHLLEEDERVLKEPAYYIALQQLAPSSVNIVVRAWVQTDDYWAVAYGLNEKVYKVFAEKGIHIPFPQMDVHVISTPQSGVSK